MTETPEEEPLQEPPQEEPLPEEPPPPEPPPREPPPEQEEVREYRGTGIYATVVVGFVLAAALIVFIVQNTDGVGLHWTVWDARVSLAAVVLGALAIGAALAAIVGAFWRRQRRRSLQEREELRRLRSERQG